MRELTQMELEFIAGGGWLSFVFPIVIGFATGGPVGAGIAVGGIIATNGVKNLEHLHKHGNVPTIDQMVNR